MLVCECQREKLWEHVTVMLCGSGLHLEVQCNKTFCSIFLAHLVYFNAGAEPSIPIQVVKWKVAKGKNENVQEEVVCDLISTHD